jgi:hypothetical protein
MGGRGNSRALCRWLLALGVAASSGCIGFLHPIHPLPGELVTSCHDLPHHCRDHVYIFMINGLDPGNFCNLAGVRDYLHTLGFNKTYYGQMYHGAYFEKEVCRLHTADPEARFVLIGFSYGANIARSIAQDVKEHGINIDLLVYLGGNTMTNTPKDRPENVGQIVNVLATGWVWNGDTLDGAENVNLPDVWHFGSPSHPQTVQILARDLVEVAAHVPVPVRDDGPIPWTTPETAPPPRPVKEAPAAPRGEWDFLKPAPQLQMPKIVDTLAPQR